MYLPHGALSAPLHGGLPGVPAVQNEPNPMHRAERIPLRRLDWRSMTQGRRATSEAASRDREGRREIAKCKTNRSHPGEKPGGGLNSVKPQRRIESRGGIPSLTVSSPPP
jgi:hypothetical protein